MVSTFRILKSIFTIFAFWQNMSPFARWPSAGQRAKMVGLDQGVYCEALRLFECSATLKPESQPKSYKLIKEAFFPHF